MSDASESPRDNRIGNRIVEQALELWIKPEIIRRQEEDGAEQPFPLRAAQVIFDPDADVVEVRLNNEVRIGAEVEKSGPVSEGEMIAVDPSLIHTVVLTHHDPNAGHITLLEFGGKWLVAFNLVRNAARTQEHLTASDEFLTAAAGAFEAGHMRAFAENLFAAVELLAKADLLSLPGREILDGKTHKLIKRRLNLYGGKLGNMDGRFVKAYNELHDLRGAARYLRKPFDLDRERGEEMMEIARSVKTELEGRSTPVLDTRGVGEQDG